jgi:hypothetical protein
LHVEGQEAERVAERIVEDSDAQAFARPTRQRPDKGVADGIGSKHVVLEQEFGLGAFDQFEHRREGLGAIS